jgi:hypothetical protein
MSERFIHYSSRPLAKVRTVKQDMRADRGDKPDGLWFSVGDGDDGWRAWCEAGSYSLGKIATEIVLRPSAKMLRIDGVKELDAFTAKYGMIPAYATQLRGGRDYRGYAIDWRRIAQDHQGIIIAPYCWERRLTRHTFWYYTWDCASGVVWDANAVAEVRVIEQAPA